MLIRKTSVEKGEFRRRTDSDDWRDSVTADT
jgi:hypothetical protein